MQGLSIFVFFGMSYAETSDQAIETILEKYQEIFVEEEDGSVLNTESVP